MNSKEEQLKFDYLCIYNSLQETKQSLSHWSIVYKYVSKALNDITTNGWSTFESMLPHSDREILYKEANEKLLCRAQHYFEQCATKVTLLENCLEQLQKELDDNILATRELKTKSVGDKIRFNKIWFRDKPYDFGAQTELFTIAQ